MTARFTADPPLASAGSWPVRPSPARLAQLETTWRANMARRDAAAKEYGEPETPHEFYRGRPGSQAETIVLDCLRALQAIPEFDRLFADELMDVIARDYIATATGSPTRIRRLTALLEIAGGKE